MYKITKEIAAEIRAKMKHTKNSAAYRRLQAVALRGEGKKNKEISEITKFHPDHIGKLARIYCERGVDALIEDGRKGGNNCNMTTDEEKAFLSQFEEAAKSGQIITISDIATAYDQKTAKERESKSTVYYLLHKHGWRQLVPQTAHPGKASDEVMAASKKLKISTTN